MTLLDFLLCRSRQHPHIDPIPLTYPYSQAHATSDTAPKTPDDPFGRTGQTDGPASRPTLVPTTLAAEYAQALNVGQPLFDISPRNFQNSTRDDSTITLDSAVSYSTLTDSHIGGVSEVIGTKLAASTIVNCRVTHSNLSTSYVVGESDIHQCTMTNSTVSGNSILKYCNLRNSHVCCGADLSQCTLINVRVCGGRSKHSRVVDSMLRQCDLIQVKVDKCAVSDQRVKYGSMVDRVDEQTRAWFRDHTEAEGGWEYGY